MRVSASQQLSSTSWKRRLSIIIRALHGAWWSKWMNPPYPNLSLKLGMFSGRMWVWISTVSMIVEVAETGKCRESREEPGRRWAIPIDGVSRPFGAGRRAEPVGDGRYPSMAYLAPSGLGGGRGR